MYNHPRTNLPPPNLQWHGQLIHPTPPSRHRIEASYTTHLAGTPTSCSHVLPNSGFLLDLPRQAYAIMLAPPMPASLLASCGYFS